MRSPYFHYFAFFATGLATASTSALVALHGGFAVRGSDADIGQLIAAQFSGQLIGSFFVRRNVPSRLLLGASLTGVAAASLAFVHALSLPLLFVFGLGLGLSMASINTLTGLESPPEQCARRLEILNIFWPLGAAACPWLLAQLPLTQLPPIQRPQAMPVQASPLTLCFALLALLFFVIAAGTLLRMRQPGSTAENMADEKAEQGSSLPLLLSLLALLAVGVESGIANWLPTFQLRYLPPTALLFPLATLFWVSILVSRLLASRWMTAHSERSVLVTATLALTFCVSGLVLLERPWMLACATLAAAVAIGPVYPLLLTRTIRLRGRGLVFFSASSGSALFPWLIGRFATISHSLRTGMVVALAGGILLCAFSCGKGSSAFFDEPSASS